MFSVQGIFGILFWPASLLTFSLISPAAAQVSTSLRTQDASSQTVSAVDAAVERQLTPAGTPTRTPARVSLSPDGARIAWSLPGAGGAVLHVSEAANPKHDLIVSPASPDGSACSSDTPVWSPDNETLAFSAACPPAGVGGRRPQQQIYLWNVNTGAVRQLTHLTGGLSNLAWSFDGKRVLFLFIEDATRDPGYGDPAKPLGGVIDEGGFEVSRLYQADAATGQGRFLTPETMHVYEFGIASGARKIVFLAAPPPGEASWPQSKLYTVGMPPTGAAAAVFPPRTIVDPQSLTGPLHGMQMAIPRLSPDGRRAAFICGLMSDPVAFGGDLCIADSTAEAGTPVDVTPDLKASAQYEHWLTNDTLSFVENRNGHTLLVDWDVAARQPVRHATVDLGEVTVYGGGPQGPAGPAVADISYAPAQEAMAFEMQGHDLAPEVYTVRHGNVQQFTHLNDGIPPPTHTISVEWENEGCHVQGWLSFPANYDPHKSYPLLVEAHGGPEWSIGSRWGASVDGWRGISPFWPGMGYFLFSPNPRGSFGQGEAFTAANRRDLGYGDLRDILKGMDAIEAKYPIDKSREGLLGWSYGGCMSMFAVTQTQRFHAAVAGAGIADYTSFYGETFFTTFTLSLFGGTPYEDPAIYVKLSPVTFIKQAKTPTLVLVGERDQESTPEQSLEFWRGLRTVGTPTRLVVYPGEGHSFNKVDSNDTLRRAAEWFAQYMPAAAPPVQATGD